MTTLQDRQNTGLLVVDVQNGVVESSPGRDSVVSNIASLVDRARRAGVPVVWVQHRSEALKPGLGVGRLLVVGAQTDACIRSTLHGALVRGYDTVLVSDAHTTEDLSRWGAPPPEQVIAHTNLHWSEQTAPGRAAGTVATAGVDVG